MNLLLVVAVGIVIAGIVAWLFVKRYHARKTQIVQTITIAEEMKQRLDQYHTKMILPGDEPAYSHIPVRKTPVVMPEPEHIDCLNGKTTIVESLKALAKKYTVEQITLATKDGLLLASSRDAGAAADAATFSQVFSTAPQTKIPGVIVFGIDHKGSTIIGSVRNKTVMGSEREQKLKDDTKDILNWWI
jgi:hypothetical protein